jgi:uncharacterized OB-fold protein
VARVALCPECGEVYPAADTICPDCPGAELEIHDDGFSEAAPE